MRIGGGRAGLRRLSLKHRFRKARRAFRHGVVVGAGLLATGLAFREHRAMDATAALLASTPPTSWSLRDRRAAEASTAPPPLQWVDYECVPKAVVAGIVAAEDAAFLEHAGVAWAPASQQARGALLASVVPQGASTLTQQLARTLYLSPERSYWRKLRELAWAVSLEHTLSKRRILELYLNVAEFGPNVFGIQAAAATYFQKPARLLAPREGAWLASRLPRPLTASADPSAGSNAVVERIIRRAGAVAIPERRAGVRCADLVADDEFALSEAVRLELDPDWRSHPPREEVLSQLAREAAPPGRSAGSARIAAAVARIWPEDGWGWDECAPDTCMSALASSIEVRAPVLQPIAQLLEWMQNVVGPQLCTFYGRGGGTTADRVEPLHALIFAPTRDRSALWTFDSTRTGGTGLSRLAAARVFHYTTRFIPQEARGPGAVVAGFRCTPLGALPTDLEPEPRIRDRDEGRLGGSPPLDLAPALPPTADPNVDIDLPSGDRNFLEAALDRGVQRTGSASQLRLAYFGDSTILGDGIVGQLREQLQARIGAGGAGRVVPASSWRGIRHRTVSVRAEGGWESVTVLDDGGRTTVGLAGTVVIGRAGARVRFGYRSGATRRCDRALEIVATPERETSITWRSEEDSGHVRLAGSRAMVVTVQSASPLLEGRGLELAIESGQVLVHGVYFHCEAGSPGAVVDTYAFLGGQPRTLLRVLPERFAETAVLRPYDGVLVQFGGNDLWRYRQSRELYGREFHDLLERLRTLSPHCLVLAPVDQGVPGAAPQSKAELAGLVGLQREVALREGCAFWDTTRAMGGPGAMHQWRRFDRGLVWGDLLHLRVAGGDLVADLLFAALTRRQP